MLITDTGLHDLVARGVVEGAADCLINAASIDITCGRDYIQESFNFGPVERFLRAIPIVRWFLPNMTIDLLDKGQVTPKTMGPEGVKVRPGDWILLTSEQKFNLPTVPRANAAEYKLKSTMARNGVDAFNAGWCDPGWHGGHLTIELRNCNRWTTVVIKPGVRIGQMILSEGAAVRAERSYATRGRYNHQGTVTPAR